MRTRTLLAGLISVSTALAAVSCAKKNVKNADAPKTAEETAAMPALDVIEGTAAAAGEGDIRSGEFIPQETVRTVHFDFDRYALSDGSRTTLQKNADILKARKEWTVMVEGHCDSRGTVEYNLALGQKRAKEVRDYYIRLGVSESSIGTISYGEEKPVCEEENETCWAANRRAETKVRTGR